ncbi:MAG TPA: PrgI family protein [Candidatus Saccharimonadales bacterium]|nr:PrgI family protein [Candidatus Saccharimonadales bacterium]
MAVYKVIQDIEAEDKLLGPLSFKAFVYALIAGVCVFIEIEFATRMGGIAKVPFMFLFLGPLLLFGVLASPLGREQPTEVWLLSRIRFFLKPRKRIWDQSGTMDLVEVTAPKKKELHLTKELSQDEVQSRLKTLATTLDTRGWAVKNVDVNLNIPEVQAQHATPESDRLVGTAGVPQQMAVVEVHAADDILDEKHNPTAQKFEALMQKAAEDRRHSLLTTIKGLVDTDTPHRKAVKSKAKTKRAKATVKEADTKDLAATKRALEELDRQKAAERARKQAEEEAELAQKLARARESFNSEFEAGHIKPNPHHRLFGAAAGRAGQQGSNPVTAVRQTDNMELAQSGSAFSVSTLSQLANRPAEPQQPDSGEVAVSLH